MPRYKVQATVLVNLDAPDGEYAKRMTMKAINEFIVGNPDKQFTEENPDAPKPEMVGVDYKVISEDGQDVGEPTE